MNASTSLVVVPFVNSAPAIARTHTRDRTNGSKHDWRLPRDRVGSGGAVDRWQLSQSVDDFWAHRLRKLAHLSFRTFLPPLSPPPALLSNYRCDPTMMNRRRDVHVDDDVRVTSFIGQWSFVVERKGHKTRPNKPTAEDISIATASGRQRLQRRRRKSGTLIGGLFDNRADHVAISSGVDRSLAIDSER